jgi:hypothetical protein
VIGKDIVTNGYGEEIQTAFREICDALSATYGTPQIADFLKTGSIWSEPREWTMGLLKKERELFALWNKDPRLAIVLESHASHRRRVASCSVMSPTAGSTT